MADFKASGGGAVATDVTGAVTEPPTANSLQDILHKDGSFTFDNTSDSLEALRDFMATLDTKLDTIDDFVDTEVAAIQSDLDNGTDGLGALKSLLDAIPTTTMRGTDSAALASVVGALNTAAATGAVTSTDEIMAYVKQLVTGQLRSVQPMDFWSVIDPIITLNASAGDEALPSVTVANIPSGAVVSHAYVMMKIRAMEDTSGSSNSIVLAGTEHIQIDKTGGSYIDAITMVAGMWEVAGTTRDGGDYLVGSLNVASEVDGNDTYELKIEGADVTAANLILRDVQVGIRVYLTPE